MKLLSLEICIKTLSQAASTRWRAVQLEMAVGVLYFAVEKSTNKQTRKAMMEVYASAGYECLSHTDRDYKSIWGRVQASAKLYRKLTHRVVMDWAGEQVSSQMIDSVAVEIAKLNLCTITDVLDYCSGERAPRAKRQPVTEAPGTVHVKTAHLNIPIPPDIGYDELMEAAAALIELAKKHKGAVKAKLKTRQQLTAH